MNGHSEIPIPGGFGAAGAPNDAWHQAMHSLTKSYLRYHVGWGCRPDLRKRFDELQCGPLGLPSSKRRGE